MKKLIFILCIFFIHLFAYSQNCRFISSQDNEGFKFVTSEGEKIYNNSNLKLFLYFSKTVSMGTTMYYLMLDHKYKSKNTIRIDTIKSLSCLQSTGNRLKFFSGVPVDFGAKEMSSVYSISKDKLFKLLAAPCVEFEIEMTDEYGKEEKYSWAIKPKYQNIIMRNADCILNE